MKAFYLGIDVSKGYADFELLDSSKEAVTKGFQLDDTFEGHHRLHELFQAFLSENPGTKLYVGVESTGGFENNWFNRLQSFREYLNIHVARLNPSGVNFNSKADLKRNKTDKMSARNIAEFMISHPEKIRYDEPDVLTDVRRQWAFVQMLRKQATMLRNQLQSLLYITNPELLKYCTDGFTNWILQVLLKYPTSAKLQRAHLKSLVKIPFITEDRAKELIGNAKKSVASNPDTVAGRLVVDITSQILHLEKSIKTQIRLLESSCSDIKEVSLLQTFIGIGTLSAIGLYLEIGNIARFKNAKSLAAYWGVHPIYATSGDGVGSFRMSKKGRKKARNILFTVTLSAIENNPLIKALYQKQIGQGRAKMDAIGICMHKTTRIIFGMLKNGTPFDPEIDKANKQRSLPDITKRAKQDKSRRFQSYDSEAPVSRRQTKKRKERARSQSASIGTMRGISQPVPIKDSLAKAMEKLKG